MANIKGSDLCWYRRKRTLDDTHPAEPTHGRILDPARSACVINSSQCSYARFMLFRHHMPSMPMTADILLYNNRAVSGESFLAATNAPPRRNLVRIMMAAQHRISAYGLSAVSVLSQRWSETRPCSLLSALSNGPYYNVSLLTTLSKRSFCYQKTRTFVYTQHLKGSFNLRHKICIKKVTK